MLRATRRSLQPRRRTLDALLSLSWLRAPCQRRYIYEEASDDSDSLQRQLWRLGPTSSTSDSPLLSQYNSRLSEAIERKRTSECFKLAAEMKQNGVLPNIYTYNILLWAASTHLLTLDAWALFDDLILMGETPNTFTFAALLNAHRQHSNLHIWGIYEKMLEMGVTPNSTIYVFICRHFINTRNLEMALRIRQIMKAQGHVLNLKMEQALITLAASSGYPRLAVDLATSFESDAVRKLDPDVWFVCLSAAADELWVNGVVQCWDIVKGFNIPIDEGTHIKVLNTAARSGNLNLALSAVSSLNQLGIPLEEHHLSPVLEAFCNAGHLKDAFSFISSIRQYGITPTWRTSTPIFNKIRESTEAVDKAWSLIDELRREDKPIDVLVLNSILRACVEFADQERAVSLYGEFGSYGATPDMETFKALFQGLEASHLGLSSQLLDNMKAISIPPDKAVYETVIRLHLAQPSYEDAFVHLEEMKAAGFKPSNALYLDLINTLSSRRDERVQIALDEYREQGYHVGKQLLAAVHRKYGGSMDAKA